MFDQKQITVNTNFNFNAILYGTVFALATSVVLLIISGAVMYFARVAEVWASLISSGIFAISIFAGGIFAARRAGEKGLLHGVAVGITFVLLTSVLTLFLPVQASFLVFLKKAIYGIIAGLIGGILGVK